jgi:hypothetical protein
MPAAFVWPGSWRDALRAIVWVAGATLLQRVAAACGFPRSDQSEDSPPAPGRSACRLGAEADPAPRSNIQEGRTDRGSCPQASGLPCFRRGPSAWPGLASPRGGRGVVCTLRPPLDPEERRIGRPLNRRALTPAVFPRWRSTDVVEAHSSPMVRTRHPMVGGACNGARERGFGYRQLSGGLIAPQHTRGFNLAGAAG